MEINETTNKILARVPEFQKDLKSLARDMKTHVTTASSRNPMAWVVRNIEGSIEKKVAQFVKRWGNEALNHNIPGENYTLLDAAENPSVTIGDGKGFFDGRARDQMRGKQADSRVITQLKSYGAKTSEQLALEATARKPKHATRELVEQAKQANPGISFTNQEEERRAQPAAGFLTP